MTTKFTPPLESPMPDFRPRSAADAIVTLHLTHREGAPAAAPHSAPGSARPTLQEQIEWRQPALQRRPPREEVPQPESAVPELSVQRYVAPADDSQPLLASNVRRHDDATRRRRERQGCAAWCGYCERYADGALTRGRHSEIRGWTAGVARAVFAPRPTPSLRQLAPRTDCTADHWPATSVGRRVRTAPVARLCRRRRSTSPPSWTGTRAVRSSVTEDGEQRADTQTLLRLSIASDVTSVLAPNGAAAAELVGASAAPSPSPDRLDSVGGGGMPTDDVTPLEGPEPPLLVPPPAFPHHLPPPPPPPLPPSYTTIWTTSRRRLQLHRPSAMLTIGNDRWLRSPSLRPSPLVALYAAWAARAAVPRNVTDLAFDTVLAHRAPLAPRAQRRLYEHVAPRVTKTRVTPGPTLCRLMNEDLRAQVRQTYEESSRRKVERYIAASHAPPVLNLIRRPT